VAAASIDEIREVLLARLGTNTVSLGPISTRVLLRTGVSLKTPRPDQNRDATAIANVIAALADMGHRL